MLSVERESAKRVIEWKLFLEVMMNVSVLPDLRIQLLQCNMFTINVIFKA